MLKSRNVLTVDLIWPIIIELVLYLFSINYPLEPSCDSITTILGNQDEWGLLGPS